MDSLKPKHIATPRSAIYALIINNKHYIGSAVDVNSRMRTHKANLNLNQHPNKHLQSAYNKYQEFDFKILEYCEPQQLLEKEQFWIDWTKAYEVGYNKRQKPNSNLGLKFSDDTKTKMSVAHLGRIKNSPTDEALAKSSESHKNLEKWPHGCKCKCRECKNKRNHLRRLWHGSRNLVKPIEVVGQWV